MFFLTISSFFLLISVVSSLGPFCENCPSECYIWCLRVSNNTSPCDEASTKDFNNKNCRQLQCVNFYCGAPSALFCKSDGSIERGCFPPGSPFEAVQTGSSCWQFFESQCKAVTNRSLMTPNTVPAEVTVPNPAVRPPKGPPRKGFCLGCPNECGDLCKLATPVVSPCLAYNNDANYPNRQQCADRCRSSYCTLPHAYFCDDSNEIDMKCTTSDTAMLFINSSNEICRNWYLGQCNPRNTLLTPGIPKVRPTTLVPAVTTTEPVTVEIEPLQTVANRLTDDICEASCPEACGDFCDSINFQTLMSSPCLDVRLSDDTCVNVPCRNLYCKHPLAVFCADDNQIEWNCTAKGANALLLLNSTGEECHNWFLSLCATRHHKMTPPPFLLPPSNGNEADVVPEPCANDCPSKCGDLCRMVNAIAAPCNVANTDGGVCPAEKCHNFYCHMPFALYCTDDHQINFNCSDQGAYNFINSPIEECRNWIADKCKTSVKSLPLRSLVKRQAPASPEPPVSPSSDSPFSKLSTIFRKCQDDCPVDECGTELCNLYETVISPCTLIAKHDIHDNITDSECPVERCRNLYCGAPMPFYCFSDGTMDYNCTVKNNITLRFLESGNQFCSEWFVRQCKLSRVKGTTPRLGPPTMINHQGRPTRPGAITATTTTTTARATTTTTVAVINNAKDNEIVSRP